MRKRYVLEGTWTGYTSAQRRICHRVIIWKPEVYKDLKFIIFTDNTSLLLSVRPCFPRERIKEIKGYTELISDCLKYKVNKVSELPEER